MLIPCNRLVSAVRTQFSIQSSAIAFLHNQPSLSDWRALTYIHPKRRCSLFRPNENYPIRSRLRRVWHWVVLIQAVPETRVGASVVPNSTKVAEGLSHRTSWYVHIWWTLWIRIPTSARILLLYFASEDSEARTKYNHPTNSTRRWKGSGFWADIPDDTFRT